MFVVDLLGNLIAFDNRVINALITSILFAFFFGLLVYVFYGDMSLSPGPTTN